MTLSLPRSATMAWWLTAWLRGHESADAALDTLHALEGEAQLVHGLGEGVGGVVDVVTHLRRAGADAAGMAWPAEGDPLGLGGPAAFNLAALEAGEAVVTPGWGLVPEVTGEVVHWHALPAAPRQLPDVGEADRELRRALPEAADRLADLDVARWRPEVADLLLDVRGVPALDAPRGTPPRCVELAGRGLLADVVVSLALSDDGGAVSLGEIEQRRAALQPLGRAARRAVVAACSPEVWPS